MNRVLLFRSRLLILLLAAVLLGAREAQARRGIVLITHGDAVSNIGEAKLPPELSAIPELKGAKVGFHYDYFGVFWLDLWNWGGEYVLYNDAKQGEVITKQQAATLLGVPESDIGTPLNYKAPFGLDILVGIGLLSMWAKKSRNAAFRSSGSGGHVPAARVDVDRPRWTPPPPRAHSTAPPLALTFPPSPAAGSSGPPPLPPPLPPEQA